METFQYLREKKPNINNDCFAFEEKRTHIVSLFFLMHISMPPNLQRRYRKDIKSDLLKLIYAFKLPLKRRK